MPTTPDAQALPVIRYFTHYKTRLTSLVGVQAAEVVVSFYKAVLALMLFALPIPLILVTTTSPGTSTVSLLAVVGSLAIASLCGLRLVVLTNRGGQLVSAHLTNEWGVPVHIGGVKLSLRWWRQRIEVERKRVQKVERERVRKEGAARAELTTATTEPGS